MPVPLPPMSLRLLSRSAPGGWLLPFYLPRSVAAARLPHPCIGHGSSASSCAEAAACHSPAPGQPQYQREEGAQEFRRWRKQPAFVLVRSLAPGAVSPASSEPASPSALGD